MSSKCLVTGSKGFMGTFLINELKKKGYEVIDFDLPENDILDLNLLKQSARGCQTIFHLAGLLGTHELVVNSINATNVNVIGTLNILEAAKENDCKVIFTSKPNCWLNTYTITKIAAESFCQMYDKEFGVASVILKPFNVYGESQQMRDYRKAVPYMIVEALKNEPVHIYGDGEQTVDLVYAGDVAKASILASEKEAALGHIIDIGSGVELSVNEMAKLIIRLTNSNSSIEHTPMRRGETPRTRLKANTENMEKLLGYKLETNLEEGFQKTITHYKKKLANNELVIGAPN